MTRILAITILTLVCWSQEAKAQYVTTCGSSCTTTTVISCCLAADDSYAASVAKWAVELQLRSWLVKKPDDLTREDIKDRRTKLDALIKWADKEVENKVFASAYLRWAENMKSTLKSASDRLDRDEIASALLLHGLPKLPANAQ